MQQLARSLQPGRHTRAWLDRHSIMDGLTMTKAARQLLADIEELAPEIISRATEIETARRIR
jgi:hypothetical protein